MNQTINSPFRYAGGKFYARKLILEHIPIHISYIEPFAGGASIFFAKNKAEKNWLNDIDEGLMNCFTIIRDYPEELIKKLDGEKATKERHSFYKNIFKPKNKLEKAVRWFYLNRTSYSGIMNMQNCFWGYGDKFSMRPENWPRNIRNTSKKLQGVMLTSYDFDSVINKAEDSSFLFIDPPYFNADQSKFYTHSFKKDDHLRLGKILKENSHRFKYLITYDDCEEIRDMYSWALEIHSKQWNYTINRTDDQKKNGKNGKKVNGMKVKGSRYKGKEIFITNYPSVFQRTLSFPFQQAFQ
ncbi:DNA adenine methylase [Candidatus Roizmanbacteria bacterium]|nr:DNA adenine methylase [Candidatus Roizmanbacteria bacterium]